MAGDRHNAVILFFSYQSKSLEKEQVLFLRASKRSRVHLKWAVFGQTLHCACLGSPCCSKQVFSRLSTCRLRSHISNAWQMLFIAIQPNMRHLYSSVCLIVTEMLSEISASSPQWRWIKKIQQQHFLPGSSVPVTGDNPQTSMSTVFIGTTFYWRNSPFKKGSCCECHILHSIVLHCNVMAAERQISQDLDKSNQNYQHGQIPLEGSEKRWCCYWVIEVS